MNSKIKFNKPNDIVTVTYSNVYIGAIINNNFIVYEPKDDCLKYVYEEIFNHYPKVKVKFNDIL